MGGVAESDGAGVTVGAWGRIAGAAWGAKVLVWAVLWFAFWLWAPRDDFVPYAAWVYAVWVLEAAVAEVVVTAGVLLPVLAAFGPRGWTLWGAAAAGLVQGIVFGGAFVFLSLSAPWTWDALVMAATATTGIAGGLAARWMRVRSGGGKHGEA